MYRRARTSRIVPQVSAFQSMLVVEIYPGPDKRRVGDPHLTIVDSRALHERAQEAEDLAKKAPTRRLGPAFSVWLFPLGKIEQPGAPAVGCSVEDSCV